MKSDAQINLFDGRTHWTQRLLWRLMFWGLLSLLIWVTRDNVGWSFVLGIVFLLSAGVTILGYGASKRTQFHSLDELQAWVDDQRKADG